MSNRKSRSTVNKIIRRENKTSILRPAFPRENTPPVKARVHTVTSHYHDTISVSRIKLIMRNTKTTGILRDGTRVFKENGMWMAIEKGGRW